MYLLFDIGGTKMRLAVSRDRKKVAAVRIVSTPQSFHTGIQIFKLIAEELVGGKKIFAVSGGIAGSFDRTKTKIIGGGSNIQDWVGKPIRRELERIFRVPVYLENDAALSGLAEAVRGAGQGKEIMVYYTVSTGFGGARIVNGKIDFYARGFEPTNQIVDLRALLKDYRRGRIGEYISGKGIEERFHKSPEKISNRKIRDDLAKYLAVALNNGILHWSPDLIVIGGPVMKIISLERTRFHLRKIYKEPVAPPPVVKSKLGDLSVIYGALVYLNQIMLF